MRPYCGQTDLSAFVPHLDGAWRALTSGILGDHESVARENAAGRAPWPHNYLFMPTNCGRSLQEPEFATSGFQDLER
jgi:hypothetical protein